MYRIVTEQRPQAAGVTRRAAVVPIYTAGKIYDLADRFAADVPLCPDNTFLIIEHDRDRQVGSIGFSPFANLCPLHETVTIFDAVFEKQLLPEPYSRLRAEVDMLGGPYRDIIGVGMLHGESNRKVYAWELDPAHRPDRWRNEYKAILRPEREAWV